MPPARGVSGEPERGEDNSARQTFRKRLREGKIDDLEIEIEVAQAAPQMDVMTPPGMEEMAEQLRGMFAGLARDKTKPKKMKVRDAFKLIVDEEAAKRINEEDLRTAAINNVEQNGIVFLDEIDKIAARQETGGADVSRQGVQRDLLPLVEGTTVNTRYGMVRTDHILFIASGAFHLSRPSDLIPELQGRFPIRVELDSLSAEDFVRILSSTDASLTKQYTALMATEGLELEFTEEGVRRLAELAYDVNETTENIGAPPVHGDGEAAGRAVVRCHLHQRQDSEDRRRLRQRATGRSGQQPGSGALRAVRPGAAQAVPQPSTKSPPRSLAAGSAASSV